MKKIFAYIVTGLLLIGSTVIAEAANYNTREDCCTEGPPYNREFQGPAISTIVVLDQGSLYIEGMGFAPRPKGPKTIVPKVAKERDWCCEDMSKVEEDMHFKKVNIIEPAAGH